LGATSAFLQERESVHSHSVASCSVDGISGQGGRAEFAAASLHMRQQVANPNDWYLIKEPGSVNY